MQSLKDYSLVTIVLVINAYSHSPRVIIVAFSSFSQSLKAELDHSDSQLRANEVMAV